MTSPIFKPFLIFTNLGNESCNILIHQKIIMTQLSECLESLGCSSLFHDFLSNLGQVIIFLKLLRIIFNFKEDVPVAVAFW